LRCENSARESAGGSARPKGSEGPWDCAAERGTGFRSAKTTTSPFIRRRDGTKMRPWKADEIAMVPLGSPTIACV